MNPTYDMPQNYYYGGGAQDTFVTPLAAVILCLAIVLIFRLRRKLAIVPFLVAGVLLPFDVTIVVSGFHFQALRLLLLAAWLRIVLRRDIPMPRLNPLDKAVLFWTICNAIFFIILDPIMGAVNNRIGFLLTNLGTYFLVRALIRDKDDVVRAIRVFAILIAIIAPFMLIERFTQHNAFSIVGAQAISAVREGSIRAQGPFGHSIIAGTIGGMLLPLFVGLWWQNKRQRMLLGLGVASSLGMVMASSSSTPLMTVAAGVFALLLWSFRSRLRILRWTLLLSVATLQLAMKAPIWFLIARAGGIFGGSGFHRAMLIDTFVSHFGEWWLIGTRNNVSWGYDMWDVDNAYVSSGLNGGLITFVAFIAILVYAYKRVGKSIRLTGLSRNDQRLVWAIGASLFANTAGFLGIFYFDQGILIWYALLAMVSATAVFDGSGKSLVKPKASGLSTPNTEKFATGAVSIHGRQYTS
jgi:hypothetical protein